MYYYVFEFRWRYNSPFADADVGNTTGNSTGTKHINIETFCLPDTSEL